MAATRVNSGADYKAGAGGTQGERGFKDSSKFQVASFKCKAGGMVTRRCVTMCLD